MGAKTLTGDIRIDSKWVYRDSETIDSGERPPEWSRLYNRQHAFTSGVATGQVNRIFAEHRQVTTSTTTDDLDLAGGLTDIYGDTIVFVAVKELFIVNLATGNADNLLVGGAGAGNNAWGPPFGGSQTAQARCYPNGELLWTGPQNGIPVTAGSQDTLRIQHDGVADSITYGIIIKGTSA